MRQQAVRTTGDIPLRLSLVLLLTLLSPHHTSAHQADDLLYITENYPPYNFNEKGELKGIAIDLMVLMLQKMNAHVKRSDIKMYPWVRGYYSVQNMPNTVLFTMVRSRSRDKLFKWVGPFSQHEIVLVGRKNMAIKIATSTEAARYNIGVVKNDIAEFTLKEHQVPSERIFAVPYPEQSVKMLNSGHIDLWAQGEVVALWLLKQAGLNQDNFEVKHRFGVVGDNYFAFHKDTPDHLILQFQQALNQLKADGSYQKILDHYLK